MIIRKLSLLLVGGALRCWARRIGAFGPGGTSGCQWFGAGVDRAAAYHGPPAGPAPGDLDRAGHRRHHVVRRGIQPQWQALAALGEPVAKKAQAKTKAQPKGQTKTKGQAKAKATARGKGDQEGKKGQQPAAPAGAASLHRKQVRAVRAHRACGENGDPQLCHQRLEHGHLSA